MFGAMSKQSSCLSHFSSCRICVLRQTCCSWKKTRPVDPEAAYTYESHWPKSQLTTCTLPTRRLPARLPEEERDRCILLPDDGGESVAPFEGAGSGPLRDLTPRLPRMKCRRVSLNFTGREVSNELFLRNPKLPLPLR